MELGHRLIFSHWSTVLSTYNTSS